MEMPNALLRPKKDCSNLWCFTLGDRQQCDQIWRNFATLAKLYKSLAISWELFYYWAKFKIQLGKKIMQLDQLLFLKSNLFVENESISD